MTTTPEPEPPARTASGFPIPAPKPPNPTPGTITAAVGGLALVLGLVLASITTSEFGNSCGSVFSPKTYRGVDIATSLVNTYCEQGRGRLAIWMMIALIVGGALLIGGVVSASRARSALRQAAQPDVASTLANLAQLHAAGTPSDAEYQAAKTRLLGDPHPPE